MLVSTLRLGQCFKLAARDLHRETVEREVVDAAILRERDDVIARGAIKYRIKSGEILRRDHAALRLDIGEHVIVKIRGLGAIVSFASVDGID